MLTEQGFKDLCDEIEALGYDRRTAGRFAARIGDTPCFDEQGRIVVMEDDGTELARLKLRFYGDGAPPPPDSLAILAKLPADQALRLCNEGRFDEDADKARARLAAAYQAKFGNFGEIALPEFLFEKRFDDLLRKAIKRGRVLTKGEVAAAFPDAAWEY